MIANGGEIDGVRVIDAETLKHGLESDPWVQEYLVMGFPVRYSNGGWLEFHDVWLPHMPTDKRWTEKGKGWKWTGGAGFGGSLMMVSCARAKFGDIFW